MKEEKLKVKHIKKIQNNSYAWVVYIVMFLFGYAFSALTYYFLMTFTLTDKYIVLFCSIMPCVYAVIVAVERKDDFNFNTETIEHQEVRK